MHTVLVSVTRGGYNIISDSWCVIEGVYFHNNDYELVMQLCYMVTWKLRHWRRLISVILVIDIEFLHHCCFVFVNELYTTIHHMKRSMYPFTLIYYLLLWMFGILLLPYDEVTLISFLYFVSAGSSDPSKFDALGKFWCFNII